MPLDAMANPRSEKLSASSAFALASINPWFV
jgi:hypothetical protein